MIRLARVVLGFLLVLSVFAPETSMATYLHCHNVREMCLGGFRPHTARPEYWQGGCTIDAQDPWGHGPTVVCSWRCITYNTWPASFSAGICTPMY